MSKKQNTTRYGIGIGAVIAVREHYSHTIANALKQKKRVEAETRQEARKKRSNNQQLAKLDKEGRVAKRERKRLRGK